MSTTWSIRGEYAEACSCRYLCPCIITNATGEATEDFCDFAMAYRIDTGNFGTVDLAGVTFALVAQSKKVMAAGGWIVGVIVDDGASVEQAEAVTAIASGRAGERHPIRLEQDGFRRVVTAPGVLELEVHGIASVSTSGECLGIDHTFHPANSRLNLAKAARNLITAFGIRWNDTGSQRNGHFAPFVWSGAA